MAGDVIRELECYAQALESVAPPLLVEEVASPRPLRAAPPGLTVRTATPRKGWVVAIGTAAFTFVLLGGVFLLGMLRPGEPPVGSVLSDPLVWSRLVAPGFDIPGAVGDVRTSSTGVIAVGSARDRTGLSSPAVWIQREDGEWSRVGVAGFGGVGGELRAVAEHTGRLVVIGADTESDVPAVWYSDTGTHWTRAVSDAFGPRGSEMRDVVVNFYGAYVAVGSDVWRSPDGLEWERVDFDGTGFTLLEFPDGLLAGGVDESGNQAAVWVSRDLGVTWSAVPIVFPEDLYEGSTIKAMTGTGEGFLAGGYVRNGSETHPAAWASADGYDWELVWIADDSRGEVKGIATASGHVVMVGEIDDREAFWLSTDSGLGLEWTEYAERPGLLASDPGGVESLAVGQGGEFLVGGQSDGQPSVWIGVPQVAGEQTNAGGAPSQALTCQARIENGAEWQPGVWDGGAGLYRAAGVMPCLDLQDIHYEPQQWKVSWEGTAEKLEVGSLVRFESGIHGSVYAETVVRGESGDWVTPLLTPSSGEPFTLVVMPHSFDQWVDLAWTVTPCGESGCD